jgi:hypothetical protein
MGALPGTGPFLSTKALGRAVGILIPTGLGLNALGLRLLHSGAGAE